MTGMRRCAQRFITFIYIFFITREYFGLVVAANAFTQAATFCAFLEAAAIVSLARRPFAVAANDLLFESGKSSKKAVRVFCVYPSHGSLLFFVVLLSVVAVHAVAPRTKFL